MAAGLSAAHRLEAVKYLLYGYRLQRDRDGVAELRTNVECVPVTPRSDPRFDLMVEEPPISVAQPVVQPDRRLPSQRGEP